MLLVFSKNKATRHDTTHERFLSRNTKKLRKTLEFFLLIAMAVVRSTSCALALSSVVMWK
ncbi:unnamed protein product [Amoebophrya sp. A120]|nr:unnamed protein product [Amoebophrya sp. A120]|eukprot:GSA120T00014399001.1